VTSPHALDFSQPIGNIAAACPDLLPLFDELRLDYCCRGSQTVDAACAQAGVTPDQLRAAIAARSERAPTLEADPASLTMSELCDDIERTHHAFVRSVFVRLTPMLVRIVASHGQHDPSFARIQSALQELEADMLDHMVREERVLFPWLRRLEQPTAVHTGPPWSVRRPIDCMVHDHDAVSNALNKLRVLTNGYTPAANTCGSVAAAFGLLKELEADTRRHIHKENNILFPRGVRAEASRDQRTRPRPCCSA